MSQEFDKLDIMALTKIAESGQGCPIQDAIQKLGWEERYKVLRAIHDQSVQDNQKDPSVRKLWGFGDSTAWQGANTISLHLWLDRPNWYSDIDKIYEDTLDPYTGEDYFACFPKIAQPKP